jgi:hypothetical protein
MAEPVTAKQVYDLLRQYARKRSDIGVCKALLNGVLEPASPFVSKGLRSAKPWFVLLCLLGALMVASFVYFNGLW